MDFCAGGSVIMDYELIFCPEATISSLKCLNDGFVHYKVFFPSFFQEIYIDGLKRCGLLVDYCDVLSAVWTLF